MSKVIDCHTHTELSGHGVGSVRDVVEAASTAGLYTIALTEHLALPSFMDSGRQVSMAPEDLYGYCDAVEAAREEFSDIHVVTGLEIDWIQDNNEYEKADLSRVTHLLGSVHFIEGWAFDDPTTLDEWDKRSVDSVWESYLHLWIDAVSSDIPFAVMAHPDLPKKFGHRPSFSLDEYYEEMARAVAKHGVAVEVNTAGLRKPVKEMYPNVSMLKHFNALGVDVCVGSDAHAPSEVALNIEDAYQLMRDAGYSRVFCPRPDGDKEYLPL